MVKHIRVGKTTLHFREPFQIAYEKVESAPVILVELHDEKGRVGLGSAAPDEEVSGENIDRLAALLRKDLREDFFSHPEEDWRWYKEKLFQTFENYPSGHAAVETALMHLAALRKNADPQSFFGACRDSCDLVVTVGIKSIPETKKEVEKRLEEGCRTIKLKCGIDPDEDIEKIHMVRELIPKNKKLLLDANQGYSLKDARRVLQAVRSLDIAGIEQPVKAKRHEELKSLRALDITPIIADEGAKTKEEAFRLLREDYVDGINVKLMKYGGPSVCEEILEYALSRSKLTMLGCMYESNVSITAAAYLALAHPVHFVDLDSGHFDFDDDPTADGAYVENGTLRIRGIPKLKT